MPVYPKAVEYSDKYADDTYEYRHVLLPREKTRNLMNMIKQVQATENRSLLTEDEWRSLGVQQSAGWQHYMIHKPEQHVMLFRRPLGVDAALQKNAKRGAA